MKKSRFEAELDRTDRVGLDTSVLIYHLEDVPPYSDLTAQIMGRMAAGKLEAALSTVVAVELLTRPFAEGNEQYLASCEAFLHALPGARWVPVDLRIAREAARLRGRHRLRTPDAILLATALVEGAGAFITNDSSLKRLKGESLRLLFLDDHAGS